MHTCGSTYAHLRSTNLYASKAVASGLQGIEGLRAYGMARPLTPLVDQ
jgi:hypothetical protein